MEETKKENSSSFDENCCCGCGMDARGSNHYCSITGKRVFAFCYSDPNVEGFNTNAPCQRCKPMPNEKMLELSEEEKIVKDTQDFLTYGDDHPEEKIVDHSEVLGGKSNDEGILEEAVKVSDLDKDADNLLPCHICKVMMLFDTPDTIRTQICKNCKELDEVYRI